MSANPKLLSELQNSKQYHALVLFACTRVLQTLAWEEIHQNNREPDEFVLFCIDEDSEWFTLLANQSYTEQRVSAPQGNRILYGVATETFFERFADTAPKEHDRFLRQPLRPGFVSCLVCTNEEIEIIEIKPNNFGRLK